MCGTRRNLNPEEGRSLQWALSSQPQFGRRSLVSSLPFSSQPHRLTLKLCAALTSSLPDQPRPVSWRRRRRDHQRVSPLWQSRLQEAFGEAQGDGCFLLHDADLTRSLSEL